MAFENIFKGLNINKVENYTIDNNKKNVINNNFNYSDLEDINYNSIESVNEENNISDINAAIVDLKEQGFVKELEEKIVQLKLQKEDRVIFDAESKMMFVIRGLEVEEK